VLGAARPTAFFDRGGEVLQVGLHGKGTAVAAGERGAGLIEAGDEVEAGAFALLPEGEGLLDGLLLAVETSVRYGEPDESLLVGGESDFHGVRVGDSGPACNWPRWVRRWAWVRRLKPLDSLWPVVPGEAPRAKALGYRVRAWLISKSKGVARGILQTHVSGARLGASRIFRGGQPAFSPTMA